VLIKIFYRLQNVAPGFQSPKCPHIAAPDPAGPLRPAQVLSFYGQLLEQLARISHHGAPVGVSGPREGQVAHCDGQFATENLSGLLSLAANKALIAPEFRSERIFVPPNRHTSTWNVPKRAPISGD